MKATVLRAGEYEVEFRPERAMLCTSLRFRGEQYVAWPRTMTQFRAGMATAIPLMHPWINRLGGWEYDAVGVHVDLHGLQLPTDQNGLPMHGNLFGAAFDVVAADDAHVVVRLDYDTAAFPFAHALRVDARVDAESGLTITTTVEPTATISVPISFGWHPYLRLPSGGRNTWELRWPECEHIEVDARTIPTGARTKQSAQRAPIGRRTFDDHYALGDDRTFAIVSEGRTLTLRFGDTYPFAQLFVPPRRQLLAIEPMTAEIDALGRGTTPLVRPGERFSAAFTITVTR